MASEAKRAPGRARRCAILAGGLGTRIGGGKPLAPLAGKPLAAHAVAAARRAGLEPLLVAKRAASLEALGATVLLEPPSPRHPLLGVVTALEASGETVVTCPCDVPLLGSETLAELASLAPGAEVPLLVGGDRGPEPLIGIYPPGCAPALRDALERELSSREAARRLGARIAIDLQPVAATRLLNVNTIDDLERAERELGRALG